MTKVIRLRDLIRKVPEEWRSQYSKASPTRDADKYEIWNQLRALDLENCPPSEIDAIIGNDYWTTFRCCDCETRKQEDYLQIGQEPDYESSTATICGDCFNRIVALWNDRPELP